MNCIFCHSTQTGVVDSRPFNDCVERRRQCLNCSRRFITIEKPISRDNQRQYKPIGRPTNTPCNYYTVYDFRTDEVLASGTAKECAKSLEICIQSFYKAVMKSNRGESKKYYILTDKENNSEDYDD